MAEGSLEDIFRDFCAFGGKSQESSVMDGAKFAKLCKDMKLLDKKLTPTDVDIIFAKSKPEKDLAHFEPFLVFVDLTVQDPGLPIRLQACDLVMKAERKITFEQFQESLKLLAEKKYPGDPNGVKKITTKLISGSSGPVVSGATKTASSGIVERMTDTSKYTGSHKHRFDEEGKGKGLEGRDSIPKGKGMVPGSVSGQPAYVTGYKGDGAYTSSPKSSPKPKAKGDVLDRLTDTSKYTGSHKHRFDEGGHGKGLLGRDAPAKGAGMSPGSVKSQASYVTGYKGAGTYNKK